MKKPKEIIVIEKTKKIMKVIRIGMFQKISNWHDSPATMSTTVVIVLKTIPTMNQLIQYTPCLTPTTFNPYLSLSSFSLTTSFKKTVKVRSGVSMKK
jgi:hypothetical protein